MQHIKVSSVAFVPHSCNRVAHALASFASKIGKGQFGIVTQEQVVLRINAKCECFDRKVSLISYCIQLSTSQKREESKIKIQTSKLIC